MFGYVKAYMPELKMCEYEYYRAAYCGLCRANGRCTGQCSRFLLNYDFVFLALVRLALTGERVRLTRRRCIVHPLKKRNEMIPGGQLNFCANAAALLNYHKLRDDIADESGFRRIRARFAMLFVRGMRRRAARALPGLDERISALLGGLSALEREKCASVDLPAEIFGELTADILSYGLEGASASTARQIGLHIGKWIYIADALDDYKGDISKGRYNPFAALWADGIPEESLAGIRAALTHELMDAELGFDLLDYGDNALLRGVVSNIIYCGMPRRATELACGGGEEKAVDE